MPNINSPIPSDNNNLSEQFKAFCERTAYQTMRGVPWQDAVDRCHDWALTRGVYDAIGVDAAQAIMADEFLPYRRDMR